VGGSFSHRASLTSLRTNRSAASAGSPFVASASAPAVVPGHHGDQLRMPGCGRQCDVAAVAVPEDQSATTGQLPDQVVHLPIGVERPGVRCRSAVPASVVPQHPERPVETPAESQHAG
jgi:hypothetical protein